MKEPLISVIVPCFDAEKYIEKCLTSIINQTYKNLEIILVDDCSTDNTIAEITKINDERIILIQNETNKGQSYARNLGLKKATGEYIGFVDSDDFVDLDYYEKLYKNAIETNADIVMTETRYCKKSKTTMLENPITIATDYLTKLDLLHNGSPWDKLYKFDLIKENRLSFLESRIWEDNLFVIQSIYYANKLSTIKNTFYNYVTNDSSTTRSKEKEQKRIEDSAFVASKIMEFLKSKQVDEKSIHKTADFILENMQTTKQGTYNLYETVCKTMGEDAIAYLIDRENKALKKISKYKKLWVIFMIISAGLLILTALKYTGTL